MIGNIVILDFGSQYSQLIARKVKEMGVHTKFLSHSSPLEEIKNNGAIGIILSGGPSSVYDANSPTLDQKIFKLGIPILGICYGMQLIVKLFGGKVVRLNDQEFGNAEVFIEEENLSLFLGIPNKFQAVMSHGDTIVTIPTNFKKTAYTKDCIAGIENQELQIYGVQFHPEVTHTEYGTQILKNFVSNICKASFNSNTEDKIENITEKIRQEVCDAKVVLGLSGGTDSLICALLIQKAIKHNLICVLVDTGLLRKGELKEILKRYKKYNLNIRSIDFSDNFLSKLTNVSDPEKKRKIIGREFIKAFKEATKDIKDIKYLAQGTVYSDVIESKPDSITSLNIKSHHNVGGLPKKMKLKLLEPLKDLFKDEVIELGIKLKVPESELFRHPFPGPGLAIRIIGKITKEKINILQEADSILIEELQENNLYYQMRQAFVVLLPVKSVGVMGDNRSYEYVACIRCIETLDFMSANWVYLPYYFLSKVSSRIINEVRGINRVCYDISCKPPATIEWE
ncbi:GMP synthase (glutamine-hydrolyzing) (plasmid) [Borrelia turcica IST7]|uniref:GMP synthase [glutamine-hydrolyzing] n=2 Tax=Borrelia turcica TaxID=229155 RepID=A0A386PPI9_9SPIR|nr:GMP synthase (glutamine-hydrolyzing) [Borrelia turcica IST7]